MSDDRNLLQRLLDNVSGEHHWNEGFDTDVCYGRRPDTSGTCPKLNQRASADTCGVCGCTIFGLNKAQAAPDGCPRLEKHQD